TGKSGPTNFWNLPRIQSVHFFGSLLQSSRNGSNTCRTVRFSCRRIGSSSASSLCPAVTTAAGGVLRSPPSGAGSLESRCCLPKCLTYQCPFCCRHQGSRICPLRWWIVHSWCIHTEDRTFI